MSGADGDGAPSRVLNVNVGLLGHIDSGKTSLARALSTTLSTAALDKSPQSVERGITLDLGFSSFSAPLPQHLAGAPFDGVQVTLVDCPGHASLIRTIVAGSQIIDTMVLVIDVTKGIQTQTAECLVIGEIVVDKLIVALNKADQLPAETRAGSLARVQKGLAKVFEKTRFAGCPMVVVAARPGGGEGQTAAAPEGVDALITAILDRVRVPPPERVPAPPLLFAVDHCFSVRGQGTVLTGTVLRGAVTVGASVEVPALRMVKKVKSIQVFHRPVTSAARGDRAGVCLAQMDAKLLERGLLCDPGSVPTFQVAVAAVQRIRYFKGPLPSKAKLHVSVGHATVMAELAFIRGPLPVSPKGSRAAGPASQVEALAGQLGALNLSQRAAQLDVTRGDVEFEYVDELVEPAADEAGGAPGQTAPELPMWAVLTFDAPAVAPRDSMFIGSRLDLDTAHAAGSTCRLALHGHLAAVFETGDRLPSSVRVFKRKRREGTVERWVDERTAVCRGLFKKETDISLFEGMAVTTAAGHAGVIVGAFGKSGKFKVSFSTSVPAEQRDDPSSDAQKLVLQFKRYLGQAEGQAKRMTQ